MVAPPQGPHVSSPVTLDKTSALLDINTSVAETAIYSYTIPAGLLGTDKILRCSIDGDYLNNSGSPRTLAVKITLGATTIWTDNTNTIATDAARHAFILNFRLANQNATNVQALGGTITISDPGGSASGVGDWADDEIMADTNIAGTAAEDTTAAKALSVLITHSASDATISFRRHIAILEMI